MTNVQTLEAIDWNDKGLLIHSVVDFIRREGGYDALIDVKAAETDPRLSNGRQVPMWVVRFDGNKVRNTEVHGKAYRAGFVAGIK